MNSEPSFGEAFKLHHGIQVIISTAFHDGTPIWPDHAVTALTAAFPDCGVPPAVLRQAVIEAALKAGVSVRTISAATASLPACGEAAAA